MTVLWMDGFDHYTSQTDAMTKWTSSLSNTAGSTSYTYPRRSNTRYIYLFYYAGSLGKAIDVGLNGPITIGTGIKVVQQEGTSDWWEGIHILSGTNDSQLCLYGDQHGALYISRGDYKDNVIGYTDPGVYTLDEWFYLEFNAYIHSTLGYYNVYVDGQLVLSDTNINTQAMPVANVGGIQIRGDAYYDDLYVTDGDVLGDQRVETLLPTASGTYYNEWIGVSSANHHLNVDDPFMTSIVPDDDSTYNKSDVQNAMDSYRYTISSLPEPSDIHAVQFILYTRRDNPGTRWVGSFYRERPESTNYNGTSGQVFDNYDWDSITLWNNPPSGLSPTWTEDYINASGEFGVKVIV